MRAVRGSKSTAEVRARRRFHDIVTAHGCVMCKAFPPTIDLSREPETRYVQAHHVLTQQRLRNAGLDAHLWDPRNGIALCEYHHARHHNFTERVTRDMVAGTEGFATEHGLMWMLDWDYRHERLSR